MAKAAEKKEEKVTVKVKARFDKDTRNFHAFKIKPNEHGITGGIYVDREEEVPDVVEMELGTTATEREEDN